MRAPAIAVLSALILVAVLWDSPDYRRIDFHIYAGAIAASENGSLYDFKYHILQLGFTYPPFAAVLMGPLADLPLPLAEHLWLVLQVACSAVFLVGVGRGLAPLARVRPAVFIPLTVALGMWTMPVVLNARIGQINALLVLFLVADLWLLQRRSWAAGVGSGLATAAKLTPGLLIPYFWLAGQRKAAAVAVATLLLATAVGAFFHPEDSLRYFGRELFRTERVGTLDSGFSNSLRRATSLLPSAAATPVYVVLALGVVALAYRRAARADLLTGFTLVMCASYLVSPISWGHHLFFLIPAVLRWLLACRRPWQWAIGVVALAVLFDPLGGGEHPLTSGLRILLLLWLVVALPWRPQPQQLASTSKCPSGSSP